MTSNTRELSGVKLTVKAALKHFRNRVVLVETDNKITQACINHFGGPLRLLEQHRLRPFVHVLSSTHPTRRSPKAGKVNVRAACLSRWKHDHTDIRLKPKVFEIIDCRYGPHLVDLFATRDNRLLNRYVSWRPDPLAVALNAIMLPLKGENPYYFSGRLHSPTASGSALLTGDSDSVAPDRQVAWRPDLSRLLLKPLSEPEPLDLEHRLDPPHANPTCFRIYGSYSRILAARKASLTPF